MKPEDFGYVVKNNICLFQKGPLSQWWGSYKGQHGGFVINRGKLEDFWGDEIRFTQESEIEFNCCEQWMMAAKASLFKDYDTLAQIMATKNASEQKNLGRKVNNFDAKEWEAINYTVVTTGNELKFAHNAPLRDFLKSFHPCTIFAEAAPWDKIWGIGLGPADPRALDIHTWQGENKLGRAIMGVREALEMI